MIRFLEDWKKYPNAIVHTDTTNRSWVYMAAVLKKMGVRNYYFHLALMNPALKDVDPYADNLTLEQKFMIRAECKQNIWYFLREIARIKPQSGMTPDPVRANRGNIALWWLFICHITVFLMQIRQTGKSVSTDKVLEWVLDFGANNTEIGLLTKDDDLRVANVSRIKESRKLVPDYLYAVTSRDTDNTFEVTNKTNLNKIKTFVGQKDKTAANNRGRGMTVPIVWGDEGPFTPNVDITVSAMLGATSAARDQAARTNSPYGNIFTTTAGDRSQREGQFMFNLFSSAMPWTEALYDCQNEQELYDRVKAGTVAINDSFKPLVGVACVFNHKQLGFDDDWLMKVLENVTGTPEEINKDYFNQWSAGGRDNPIPRHILTLISESETEPRFTQLMNNNYTFFWYVKNPFEYIAANHCVVGIDTSEGVGRDAISMVVRNSRTLETIGVMRVNETNVLKFIAFAGQFALMFPNTTLIPERKSTGITLIEGLITTMVSKGINPFKRIFNTLVQEADFNDNARELLKESEGCLSWKPERFDSFKKYFGFATSGTGMYSRSALYENTLVESLRMSATVVKDKTLIGELTGLEARNGRIDHKNGSNDDVVISWMLTAWLLMHGKNLRYYGIHNALSMVREVDKLNEDPEAVFIRKQRNSLVRTEVEALIGELSVTKDLLLRGQLQRQIEHVKRKLTNEDDIQSVNDMFESAKQQRREKNRDRRLMNGKETARRLGGHRSLNGFVLR